MSVLLMLCKHTLLTDLAIKKQPKSGMYMLHLTTDSLYKKRDKVFPPPNPINWGIHAFFPPTNTKQL